MRNPLAVLALAGALLAGCNSNDTKNLEQSAEKGVQKVEKAVTEGVSTAKVKSALMASSKLDSSKISVGKEGKTFKLTGSVPTEDDKKLALRIAQDTAAKDEQVVDELKVEAKPAASPTH